MTATPTFTDLLPALRGGLARPGKSEGRYGRVILRFAEAAKPDAEIILPANDRDGILAAFRDGADKVGIAGLGVISLVSPAQEDDDSLGGQVVAVTGGAGGLGFAIAQEFRAHGAAVALMDVDGAAAAKSAESLGGIGLGCDVTDSNAVDRAMEKITAHYGGVDILISNAGAAFQGGLLEIADRDFMQSLALNFWGHHFAARAAVRIMQKQGTGGALVFNISKQSVNPGAGFGAYGTAKAALLALMRQYALEHGSDGITSNGVNADRIRTGLMTESMVRDRSKARGVTPEEYMRGNLVGREVTGRDVAEAFVHLARARTTTGGVITVDGGNVAAMLR